MSARPCPCGSNLPSMQLFDARGIYCGRVCKVCARKVTAQFRPEIFTDSRYECDEAIEEDA